MKKTSMGISIKISNKELFEFCKLKLGEDITENAYISEVSIGEYDMSDDPNNHHFENGIEIDIVS